MIFSLVITFLVLGIAYFHWVQGLFSGLISAVLAVIAALLAVGYHESIATGILGGKFPDFSNAVALCATFGLIYGIGRIAFDSLIPGNVQLPLYMDRIGGGVCGLIAGLFAAGTFALAAESMSFGPSILMYSRYAISQDHDVTVMGTRRQETAKVSGALEDDLPDESKVIAMWIPADSMVADFAAFQSENGALAGSVKMRDRHENLPREMFMNRLGMENGTKRTSLNVAGRNDINVTDLFALPNSILQMDGENPGLNRGRKLDKILDLKKQPNKVLLVTRMTVARQATDTDGKFRFSLGSMRLWTGSKDVTPIGLIYEPGRVNLLMNFRADDFLIAALDTANSLVTLDVVYLVDRSDLLVDPTAKDGLKIKPGIFLEVKRMARVDLSDKDLPLKMPTAFTATPGMNMLYKREAIKSANDRVAEATGVPTAQ